MMRCRYADCREQHPVAEETEQVTCPRCRLYLGLEPIDNDGFCRIREVDLAAMCELLARAYATCEAVTGSSTLHEAVGYAAPGIKQLRNWQRPDCGPFNE